MSSPARPNPYFGPRPSNQGERLYGRDREVQELFALLTEQRIVLLYSPAGAGKTSLIQSALLPRLLSEGFRILPIIRVGLEPPIELDVRGANRYVVATILSLDEAQPYDRHTLLSELVGLSLEAYLARHEATGEAVDKQVLIFDQFEEILTIDPIPQSAKEEFFSQLGKVLEDTNRLALFSMREDYIAGLDPYRRLIPGGLAATFRLELLRPEAARLAIREPARRAGVDFTDVAVSRLVDDLRRVPVQRRAGTVEMRLGSYVDPLLLQVVCGALWDRLPPGTTQITPADLEPVSNADNILASYYAGVVAEVAARTAIPERRIRDWFEHQLITEQRIRGQVLQGPQESQGLENVAVQALANTHLVRAERRRGLTLFELTHDRLIDPILADNRAWFAANPREGTPRVPVKRALLIGIDNYHITEGSRYFQTIPDKGAAA